MCINDITNERQLFRAKLEESYSAKDTFSRSALIHTSSFIFRRSALVLPDFINKIVSGDMALFSIIAASGDLGKVSGIMSVYRKNDGGITKTAGVIQNYHKDRIILMEHLNDFHNLKFDQEAKEVISFHQLALVNIHKRMKKSFLMYIKSRLEEFWSGRVRS
jgi:hypothetical protein